MSYVIPISSSLVIDTLNRLVKQYPNLFKEDKDPNNKDITYIICLQLQTKIADCIDNTWYIVPEAFLSFCSVAGIYDFTPYEGSLEERMVFALENYLAKL